jgi:hypothetical protein
VLVLEVLLVVDEGKVLEVVLLLVDEGTVLLVLDEVVPVFEAGTVLLVVFEEGTALTKDGSLVTLPVGVTVLPL